MTATSVRLPEELRRRAERAAQDRGLSLDEYICQCLKATLGQDGENDPLFADEAVFRGPGPSDCASQHDHYLYGGQS